MCLETRKGRLRELVDDIIPWNAQRRKFMLVKKNSEEPRLISIHCPANKAPAAGPPSVTLRECDSESCVLLKRATSPWICNVRALVLELSSCSYSANGARFVSLTA